MPEELLTTPAAASPPVSGEARPPRVLALDVFRGIAIVLMLLVNNIGHGPGVPAELEHAGWSSHIHLADLAFPWFLLAAGIAMPFSIASFCKTQQPLWRYDLRVLRRSVLLFALGCLLISVANYPRIVISLGVLQLIALDTAIVAFLYALPLHRRILLSLLLLVGYWAAIQFIPVPHIGAGVFEEGRNLIEHVNRTYLAPVGLWGLPVLIPTTALVMLGTFIGDVLRIPTISRLQQAIGLMIGGVALMGVGVWWSLNLVFNKPLWTSPFILFTFGAGAAVFGVLYFILDVKRVRAWAYPFAVFGSNALLAYVLPVLFKSAVLSPLHIYTRGWFATMFYMLIWWAVCWLLYRKRWFLRL